MFEAIAAGCQSFCFDVVLGTWRMYKENNAWALNQSVTRAGVDLALVSLSALVPVSLSARLIFIGGQPMPT